MPVNSDIPSCIIVDDLTTSTTKPVGPSFQMDLIRIPANGKSSGVQRKYSLCPERKKQNGQCVERSTYRAANGPRSSFLTMNGDLLPVCVEQFSVGQSTLHYCRPS